MTTLQVVQWFQQVAARLSKAGLHDYDRDPLLCNYQILSTPTSWIFPCFQFLRTEINKEVASLSVRRNTVMGLILSYCSTVWSSNIKEAWIVQIVRCLYVVCTVMLGLLDHILIKRSYSRKCVPKLWGKVEKSKFEEKSIWNVIFPTERFPLFYSPSSLCSWSVSEPCPSSLSPRSLRFLISGDSHTVLICSRPSASM